MRQWGDGVARGFLGVLATGLLGAAVGSWWAGSNLIAGPLLVTGVFLALACAFFRDISGEVDYSRLKIRFSGPPRRVPAVPAADVAPVEADGTGSATTG